MAATLESTEKVVVVVVVDDVVPSALVPLNRRSVINQAARREAIPYEPSSTARSNSMAQVTKLKSPFTPAAVHPTIVTSILALERQNPTEMPSTFVLELEEGIEKSLRIGTQAAPPCCKSPPPAAACVPRQRSFRPVHQGCEAEAAKGTTLSAQPHG